MYRGRIQRYKADAGQKVYLKHRQESRRDYRLGSILPFIGYVQTHFRNDKWSLDACAGKALASKELSRSETVCTRTLCRYVDLGLLPIKNIDLPGKLCRNTKHHKVNEHRKNLGKSIEERPKSIDKREEFGHWEIDSVPGKQGADEPTVLVWTERKIRMYLRLKLRNHSAEATREALESLLSDFGDKYLDVF